MSQQPHVVVNANWIEERFEEMGDQSKDIYIIQKHYAEK